MCCSGQLRDVPPVEDDPAGVDVDEPHERAAERRLAGARLADDADGFASADSEVHAVQDFDAAHALTVQAPFSPIGDLDAACDEEILTHAAA